ncbi:MAG: hypothetical protein KBC42_02575 [Candidatus Pacebacteria bacterium]|jgi:hypothetical protein|nr:hypothetical protein [Candidatus Paceibacterota bacterium]MBP9780785.1 hypothetical protein [Candidatus Paceibacterota bacterium]
MIKLTLLQSTSKHVGDTMSVTSLIAGYKTQHVVFIATVIFIFILITIVAIRDQKNKVS